MTKDRTLIERLRDVQHQRDDVGYDIAREAADELDRLSRIEDKYTNLCGVLNELTREIERLTKLLNEGDIARYRAALAPSEHCVTDSIDVEPL